MRNEERLIINKPRYTETLILLNIYALLLPAAHSNRDERVKMSGLLLQHATYYKI